MPYTNRPKLHKTLKKDKIIIIYVKIPIISTKIILYNLVAKKKDEVFGMKYKIIVDSSSDIQKNYVKSNKVELEVAPLSIQVGDKSFVDDESLDTNEMLCAMNSFEGKSRSSCPNPYDFLSRMEDAENVFVITISKKLSMLLFKFSIKLKKMLLLAMNHQCLSSW